MSFIASGLAIAGIASEIMIPVAIGEAVGAGIGALTNPQDRLKGALIGAGTGAAGGALTGGLGSLLGSTATSGIGGLTGEAATEASQLSAQAAVDTATGGSAMGPAQLITPAATTAAPVTAPVMAAPVAAAPAAAPITQAPVTASPSLLEGPVGKAVASNFMSKAPQLLGTPTSLDTSSDKTHEQQVLGAANLANEVYKPLGSQGMAHGGQVRLRNGDFIIPADVVSAIGNGSTKAGARYLDHLFNALSAGPPPKAGSLAKQRAKQRQHA